MRLTLPLNHVKRYFWGKGWGHKPGKDITIWQFKQQWRAKSKKKIYDCFQSLPPNVKIEDPNKFVKKAFLKELTQNEKIVSTSKVLPWPFSQRPIKGLKNDPNYRRETALVFNRYRELLDPLNQSLFFSNTILEGREQMPESINQLISDLEISEEFIDLSQRRLEWSKSSDGTLRKLPLNRVYPYLDQKPPRVWGIPPNRRENNCLRTLYDLSLLFASKEFGLISNHKISHPYCVLKFERNQRLVVFDLETDFISTAKSSNGLPLFSTTPLITIDKPLASIEPLSWTTCFNEKNFYPIDYEFKIPTDNSIQTIFFSHNRLKTVDNDLIIGRAILYCYGYAVAQARLRYGDGIDRELPDPIPIQCVFINSKDKEDFSLSFVCFQLNTTSFDSSLKNQVWITTGVEDLNQMFKYLTAFQINGFVDSFTKNIKTSIDINL